MKFNVKISELAEQQYDEILSYIANVLNNFQALKNVMDDFDDTIEKLKQMADTFEYCNSNRLNLPNIGTCLCIEPANPK